MSTAAMQRGAVGCICDSQVRDCVKIIEMDFPAIPSYEVEPPTAAGAPSSRIRRTLNDVGEGLRYVIGHPVLRTTLHWRGLVAPVGLHPGRGPALPPPEPEKIRKRAMMTSSTPLPPLTVVGVSPAAMIQFTIPLP